MPIQQYLPLYMLYTLDTQYTHSLRKRRTKDLKQLGKLLNCGGTREMASMKRVTERLEHPGPGTTREVGLFLVWEDGTENPNGGLI